MPHPRFVLLAAAALLALLASSLPAAPASAASSAPVLAVYYAWYGAASWDPAKMSDLPATPYSSADRATIQRQVAQAKSAGIDAFEVDWYDQDAPGGIDQNLQTLLSVAQGAGFQVTAYVDLNLINTGSDLINDLTYLRHYYADPAWFHFNGKPFVAFYHTQKFDVPTWKQIFAQVDPDHQVTWMGEGIDFSYLDVFDGIHPFSIAWAPDPAAQLASFAAKARAYPGKLWMATVMPGYDDTRLGRGAAGFAVDRQNGAYYRKVWQGAIATHPDSCPDHLLERVVRGTPDRAQPHLRRPLPPDYQAGERRLPRGDGRAGRASLAAGRDRRRASIGLGLPFRPRLRHAGRRASAAGRAVRRR